MFVTVPANTVLNLEGAHNELHCSVSRDPDALGQIWSVGGFGFSCPLPR